MVKVSPIPIELIDDAWEHIEGYLQGAIDHSNNETTLDYVKQKAKEDKKLILIAGRDTDIIGAVVLGNTNFPTGKKIVTIELTGGEGLDDWKDIMLEAIFDVSRIMGATEVYIEGRPGWARKLKNDGFKTIHTVLSRRI